MKRKKACAKATIYMAKYDDGGCVFTNMIHLLKLFNQ